MTIDFFITSLIVVLIPGTGVIYTVATGLASGRVASLWAAAGCTLGIVPHIAASSLGVAAILHASALAFQVVKYCGVAYLVYLAWQSLREQGALPISPDGAPARKGASVLATGFLINILNPKLSIFFLAFLPQFIDPVDPGGIVAQTVLLGGVFMAMTLAVFIVYGVFAASVRHVLLSRPRAIIWMRRTVAAAFAGFGLRLALSDR